MAKGYVGVTSTYTPVEYIESNGTQYIDTGVYPNENIHCIVDFQYPSVPGFGCAVIGGWDSNKGMLFGVNTYNFRFAFGTSAWAGGTVAADTNRHTVYMNDENGNGRINNTVLANHSNVVSLTNTDRTLYLFGSNGGASKSTCKIFSCKIYDGTTLIRDYIPAIDSNNVACMYEAVSGKLHYNDGTSKFTAGSATGQAVILGSFARRIEKGYVGTNTFLYTALDYIESTGTQYIDTGIVPKSTTRMIYDFANTNNSQNNRVGWGSSGSQEAFECGSTLSEAKFVALVSSNTTYTWLGNVDLNRHIFDISNQAIKFDNVSYGTGNIGNTATTGQTIFLFALHAEWETTPQYTMTKLYSCKIYDGDTLVRDFTPAMDGNNVACLYEQVEGRLYYNQGTGAFTAGSATGQPVFTGEKARRIKKGYVGDSNGIARLCFRGYGETPEYRLLATGQTTQKCWSAIVGTKDYMLEIGGGETSGSTPVKTAKAYDASGVATNATDLPTQAWWSAAVKFGGLAIVAGGKTANSGSSKTNQCIAYSNNLTRQALTTLGTSIYSPAAAATTSHFFIAGGSDYYQWQYGINAYDGSLVKSTPSSISTSRSAGNLASVGNYIVCCGGFQYAGAVDFYDNSNVKTTSSDPYGKAVQFPLGLSTNSYAVFFGGSTNSSTANAYTDCKAYDSNKVLTSFNLPMAAWGAQGFSNGNYAVVCYQANELVYDDNLVLVSHTTDRNYGYGQAYLSGTADDFAMVKRNGTTELNIFDI